VTAPTPPTKAEVARVVAPLIAAIRARKAREHEGKAA
jgi:hypothetical protein